MSCEKDVSPAEIKNRVRCPYCGCKILFKKRPKVVKKLKAR